MSDWIKYPLVFIFGFTIGPITQYYGNNPVFSNMMTIIGIGIAIVFGIITIQARSEASQANESGKKILEKISSLQENTHSLVMGQYLSKIRQFCFIIAYLPLLYKVFDKWIISDWAISWVKDLQQKVDTLWQEIRAIEKELLILKVDTDKLHKIANYFHHFMGLIISHDRKDCNLYNGPLCEHHLIQILDRLKVLKDLDEAIRRYDPDLTFEGLQDSILETMEDLKKDCQEWKIIPDWGNITEEDMNISQSPKPGMVECVSPNQKYIMEKWFK